MLEATLRAVGAVCYHDLHPFHDSCTMANSTRARFRPGRSIATSIRRRSLLRPFRELSHNLRFAHRKSRGPSRRACQAPHVPHVVRAAFPASSNASSVAIRTWLATHEEKRGSAPLDRRRYIRLKCVELQIELIRDSRQTDLPIKTGQGRLAVACFAEDSCIGGRVIRHGVVSEETRKNNGRR